jgi:hypothetical protein
MRLVANGLALDVRFAFLDTADWSYLESGRDPEAAATLRALTSAGAVKVVVTHDHLVEVAGLRRGLRQRLAFMRDFPGTLLFPFSGSKLLRLAAFEFALNALGGQYPAQPVQVFPMCEESLNDLVSIAKQVWPLRVVHRLSAMVTSHVSRHSAVEQREVRDALEKLQRLARIGDRKRLEAHLAAKAPRLGGLRGVIQRASWPILLPLYDWASSRGLTARVKHADFLFDRLVTTALPTTFSTDPRLLEGLAKLWTNPEALALMSPALACVKAIAKAQTPTHDVQKIESTEHDKHHAAFAPLVHVFTCDKRNQPVVAKAVQLGRCKTRVLRTGSVAEVVKALAVDAR